MSENDIAEVFSTFGFEITRGTVFSLYSKGKMTMKDSELAREMEDKTDSIIISLMDDMKALSLQSKDLSEGKSSATSSNVQEMKTVLGVYENVIQKLWKIAENIAKTSAAEETHAGTVFMGSSGDGTYLPEISDTFDVYVMEEDSQYQLQTKLKAVDPDFERSNPNHTHLLKVCNCFLTNYIKKDCRLKNICL